MSSITPAVSPAETVRDGAALRHAQRLLLLALFALGLGVRLLHANEPPLNFHATRQYRSLLMARAYYVERVSAVPEWERRVALVSSERQGTLEPPIMERLVAVGYLMAGGEHFWLSRMLASSFWLIGGGFLYIIARRLAGVFAALFATAFYLFLPFAVLASRSFQPDPLMVMLLLASVAGLIRYYDAPSDTRLISAALVSALALLTKPVSAFPVLGVFLSLAVSQQGPRKAIRDLKNYLFLLVSLLPTAAFYLYGILAEGSLNTDGLLSTQAQSSFLPQLLLRPFFWIGWLRNVDAVVGLSAIALALLGLFLLRNRFSRAVMLGLWGGYATFCLVFSYHIATHDYYHLQLVPIVALSLAPVVALLVERILVLHSAWNARAGLAALALLVLVVALGKAESRLRAPQGEQTARMAAEIGEYVNHSTNTVYLSADYGLPLEYHGKLSGLPWPLISDLEWEQLAGLPVLSADERFTTWFASEVPDYFIVADMQEIEAQADLKQFLSANFPVVAQSTHYLIFDLRHE